MPKPGEDGERGMAVTDWRGDEGIRSLLILPPPPAFGALSRAGLTPGTVSLRLYIIPVPILDLARTAGVLEGETPVSAGGEVDADEDGGGIEDFVGVFPGMVDTAGEAFEDKGRGTEEGCEYVRSRVAGGRSCVWEGPCPNEDERSTEELCVSFNGRGPLEVVDDFLGIDRGTVDD